MSPEKLLLQRKKGAAEIEDVTGKARIEYQPNGSVRITYLSSGKSYFKSANDVSWAERVEEYDPREKSFLAGNEVVTHVAEAALYKAENTSFGSVVRIKQMLSRGAGRPQESIRLFSPDELEVHSRVAVSYVPYLEEVCRRTEKPLALPDGRKVQYLVSQFEKIEALGGTPAALIADPVKEVSVSAFDDKPVIFPFGSNLSQIAAVENALANQLSIIEGPPGTGKTQTILNIIANLIIRGKTTLVASPNGEATKNVSDKLGSYGLSYLVATLGRRENIEDFLAHQPVCPEEVAQWELSPEEMKTLETSIVERIDALKTIHQREREYARLIGLLNEWDLEYRHFEQDYGDILPLVLKKRAKASSVEKVRDLVRVKSSTEGALSVVEKLAAVYFEGVGVWDDYREATVALEIRLNRTLFEKKREELRAEIALKEKEIARIRADGLADSVRSDSLRYLKAYLCKHHGPTGRRRLFDKNSLRREVVSFRKTYPVVTTTTNAAYGQVRGLLFDYIIIDESSQASIPTGFLALASARRGVVVGDVKQLPFVLSSRDREIIEQLDTELDIPLARSCAHQSLLSAMHQSGLTCPRQLLREHYRCHPAIIGFCNGAFYNNELVVMTESAGRSREDALTAVVTRDLNYDRAGHGFNYVQAEAVRQAVIAPLLAAEGASGEDVGIISPYRAQIEGMRREFDFPGVQIDTVHKFQGREKGVIAFVTEKNDITEFLNNTNLINVAVSRAVKKFVLVAAPKVAFGHNNIASLYQYIRYQGGECIQSDVSSSFDLVYPALREERLRYLKKKGLKEDAVYTEVRTAEMLDETIKLLGLQGQISYLRNYPLRQFIIDLSSFTTEERLFIMSSAHADFLFYRVADKAVLFGLEIDGSQHRRQKQAERDAKKDAIFNKLGLGLERIATNETNVEKKLERLLQRYYEKQEVKATKPVLVDAEAGKSHADMVEGRNNGYEELT